MYNANPTLCHPPERQACRGCGSAATLLGRTSGDPTQGVFMARAGPSGRHPQDGPGRAEGQTARPTEG